MHANIIPHTPIERKSFERSMLNPFFTCRDQSMGGMKAKIRIS